MMYGGMKDGGGACVGGWSIQVEEQSRQGACDSANASNKQNSAALDRTVLDGQ